MTISRWQSGHRERQDLRRSRPVCSVMLGSILGNGRLFDRLVKSLARTASLSAPRTESVPFSFLLNPFRPIMQAGLRCAGAGGGGPGCAASEAAHRSVWTPIRCDRGFTDHSVCCHQSEQVSTRMFLKRDCCFDRCRRKPSIYNRSYPKLSNSMLEQSAYRPDRVMTITGGASSRF